MMETGLRSYGGVENYVERTQPVEPLDYWSDHISISRAAYMEISDMHDEYQRMYEDLFKKYKEVVEREEKLHVELKKEKKLVKTLEDEEKTRERRITELEELVELKEKENKQLITKSVVQFMIKAAVAQSQKEVENQKVNFHNLFVQKEILKRKHAQFVKERIQTDEKMKQLDEKVKSLEENEIESDREKKLLIVQRDAYKQDVDDLQKKLKSEKFHYEKLYLQELACRQEISKLQEENAKLRSKIKVVKTESVAEIAKQKVTINALLTQKELFKNENAKLKNETNQVQKKLNQLHETVKFLEKDKVETNREKNVLIDQRDKYKKEVDDLQEKLKSEQFLYEKLYLEELLDRQKISKLQDENTELRSKIEVVKTESVAEIAKQKLTINALFTQKELFKRENAKLKNESNQANKKLNQLDETVKFLEKDKIETNREKNVLIHQRDKYIQEVDDLQKKLKVEKFQYEKLYMQELSSRQEVSKLQQVITELTNKIDGADKEIKTLKHGIEMVASENDQLRTQIRNAENGKVNINELLENEKKMSQMTRHEMQVLKHHNKELIADQQQYKDEIRSLDADLADANSAISKLKSDLQAQDHARNELEIANGKLKKMISEINLSLREAKQYLPKKSCFVKMFRKKSLLNACIQQMEDNIINLQ